MPRPRRSRPRAARGRRRARRTARRTADAASGSARRTAARTRDRTRPPASRREVADVVDVVGPLGVESRHDSPWCGDDVWSHPRADAHQRRAWSRAPRLPDCPMRLVQVALHADDLDRAADFYTVLLESPTRPPGSTRRACSSSTSTACGCCWIAGAPASLLYLHVDNVHETLERLDGLADVVAQPARDLPARATTRSVRPVTTSGRRSSRIPRATRSASSRSSAPDGAVVLTAAGSGFTAVVHTRDSPCGERLALCRGEC